MASPQSLLQSRYDASDAGSHVLDAHSSTMKSSVAASSQSIDHHRSLSSLNPNLNKDDNDSILGGTNDKSENEVHGMENDTKSITSNKSTGSQQDTRYFYFEKIAHRFSLFCLFSLSFYFLLNYPQSISVF